MQLGKPLCDYNLTCQPKQGNYSPKQDDLSSSCTHDTAGFVSHRNVLPGNSSPSTSNTTSTTSSPVLLSSALSFIKAYRLKGDNDSLKRRVCDLSSEEVDYAKTLLWNHCMQDLEAAGLQYHARRASDKRSQLTMILYRHLIVWILRIWYLLFIVRL